MHRSSSSGVPCISRTSDTKKPASAGFSPLQPNGQATPVMRVSCCAKSRAMAVIMQGSTRVRDRGEAQRQLTPWCAGTCPAPALTVFPSGLGPRSGHKEPGRGRDPLGASRPGYQSRTRTLPCTPVGAVRGLAAGVGVGAGVSSGMTGPGATGTLGTEREAAGCAGDTGTCSSRASLT